MGSCLVKEEWAEWWCWCSWGAGLVKSRYRKSSCGWRSTKVMSSQPDFLTITWKSTESIPFCGRVTGVWLWCYMGRSQAPWVGWSHLALHRSDMEDSGGCLACEHRAGLKWRGKDRLVVMWVISLCVAFIFSVVSELSGCSWAIFPFNSNVDESTRGVCGLPSYFSPCSGEPLVLALKITWALHRWCIQEAQSK